MVDPKQLDELAEKVSRVIPKGVKSMPQDIEKNIRAVLQNAFDKMNLVSREEFEIQSAVLERTRAKLEALEQQVIELEKQLETAKPK